MLSSPEAPRLSFFSFFFNLFFLGGGRRTESVCMSLRSQVDSLALNKALNLNVNFPPVCLRVVLPPPLPHGFPLPLGRLSLSTTFLRLQRG